MNQNIINLSDANGLPFNWMNSNVVGLVDGEGLTDMGAYHRAIAIARDLARLGHWDGKAPIRIADAYAIYNSLDQYVTVSFEEGYGELIVRRADPEHRGEAVVQHADTPEMPTATLTDMSHVESMILAMKDLLTADQAKAILHAKKNAGFDAAMEALKAVIAEIVQERSEDRKQIAYQSGVITSLRDKSDHLEAVISELRDDSDLIGLDDAEDDGEDYWTDEEWAAMKSEGAQAPDPCPACGRVGCPGPEEVDEGIIECVDVDWDGDGYGYGNRLLDDEWYDME